jgi:glucosamine--fructose-6-phosphate aminotransferase (isomerizing)
MNQPDHYTWREIHAQPQAWAATLEQMRGHADELRALYRAGGYESVVFTGCGSPYYLALAAAALFQELSGIPACGLPASEIWLNPRSALPAGRRTLLVAVSRSGETTETLRAVESFRAAGRGDALTLSCYPARPLTALGAVNLVFPSGQEESFAQTRAFTTLYLATAALAALWANREDLLDELARLPDACRRLLDSYADLARSLGRDEVLQRLFFLGSGLRYGLACELSLKMKEMSLSDSEPFHFMEFRHGPQAMAGPATLILGLVSETNRRHETAVLDAMRARGARVIAIAEGQADVTLASGISEAARGALYLPFGQLLAYERAVARGHNPDRPHNLTAVVRLDDMEAG